MGGKRSLTVAALIGRTSWGGSGSEAHWSTDLHYGLEQLRWQVNAACLETLVEFRTDTGCAETSLDPPGLGDTSFFEEKDIMEQDIITLQDIFLFERTGITDSGRIHGRFRATGIRPKFYERLKTSGITLPTQLFQTVVEIS